MKMIKRLIYLTFLTSLWLGGMSLRAVLTSSCITLFVTYIILPFAYHYSPYLQRHIIFLPFVNYPWHVVFTEPEKYGVPGTRNLYIETENGIKVGVWHVLPKSLIDSCPARGSSDYDEWFEQSLSDHRPVFLYLHGNTSSRAVTHRVELYNLLRNMDWHVVAFDYRGYADSTQSSIDETGVVHDARVVYNYVKNLTRDSPLIVWGHSLGTGVSCHAVGSLCLEGNPPTALVLESPFNNFIDEFRFHPLAAIFVKMPMFEWLFLSPLKDTGIEFRSDEHIANISVPVLILHAKDDLVVPFALAKKLHETASKVRSKEFPPIKFEGFESGQGFGHKYICRSQKLPNILRSYVSEVTATK